MKKLLLLLLLLMPFYYLVGDFSYASCGINVDGGLGDVGVALDSCLNGSDLVSGDDTSITGGGFGNMIKNWVNNISLYLGIFAVGSIVYGSLMLTLSAGEDEKITKAKGVVKWGIFGFIGLLSVSAIINLVVKIMYSL